jgi:hypothetical protein
LPCRIAQDHDSMATGCLFLRSEEPPESRLKAQD